MNSKVLILERPGPEESLKIIKYGLSKLKTIIVAGLCNVSYKGRARSTLEDGERILMVKSDGNVLIHRPTGLEPVNYMPSAGGEGRYESIHRGKGSLGCIFHTRVDGERLVMRVVHKRSGESLIAAFKKIYAVAVMSLVDEGEFSLHASEEDMQRAVLQNPSLIEEGFRTINYEKRVKPGFIDVYGVDSRGRFVVVEIKKGRANRAAVMQLAKYLKIVRGSRGEEVRGVLAAPSIARGAQKLLAVLNLEYKPLDPKKCAELLERVRRGKGLESYFNFSN